MATKSSSPGPNAPPAHPPKQTRSRKAATQKQDVDANAGRAGSVGGIILDKEKESKAKGVPTAAKATAKPVVAENMTEGATGATNKPKRKPRKLNKDPVSTTANVAGATAASSSDKANTEVGAAAELEALKSRVRGLEAKVEGLYKSGAADHSNRSPRRRGKGRKDSSTQQVPTLSTTKQIPKPKEAHDSAAEEEAADEELVRLEDELEVARQDLALYRPRNRRSRSGQTSQTYADDDDVEEIPRDSPGVDNTGTSRQVTLSGSYRIPLPSSVNTEDLKTIQSGVSAAQNVARSFLEQRRAAAALREQQTPPESASAQAKRPKPPAKSMSSTMEVVKADDGSDKQSWGEWFGGYSVAISRAVKHIEHETAVESGKVNASGSGTAGAKKATQPRAKTTGKRPPANAKLSSEQVHGLMS